MNSQVVKRTSQVQLAFRMLSSEQAAPYIDIPDRPSIVIDRPTATPKISQALPVADPETKLRGCLDRLPRLDTRQPSTISVQYGIKVLLRPCQTQTLVGQLLSKGMSPTHHSFHGLLCSCGLVLVSLPRPPPTNATKWLPTGLKYHFSRGGGTQESSGPHDKKVKRGPNHPPTPPHYP